LETYQGALLIVLSIFDWNVWRILVLDYLLHPHSSIQRICMEKKMVDKTAHKQQGPCGDYFASRPTSRQVMHKMK
jgi:hypothetical protein